MSRSPIVRKQARLLPSIAIGLISCLACTAVAMANSTIYQVHLQTWNGDYVVAEGGGGGAVNANRKVAHIWETFTLIDTNGGCLMSGDPVHLLTFDGQHFVVAEGGGGREVKADRSWAHEWETFTIQKVDESGCIHYSDSIALQASNGQYVVAEGGGGGVVNANRDWRQQWETFLLQYAGPTDGTIDHNGFWTPLSLTSMDCRAECALAFGPNVTPVVSGEVDNGDRAFTVCRYPFHERGWRAGYNVDGENTCGVGSGAEADHSALKSCLCNRIETLKWERARGDANCVQTCTPAAADAVATGAVASGCVDGSPHQDERYFVCSANAFGRGERSGYNHDGSTECVVGSGGESVYESDEKYCLCYDRTGGVPIHEDSCYVGTKSLVTPEPPSQSSETGDIAGAFVLQIVGTGQTEVTLWVWGTLTSATGTSGKTYFEIEKNASVFPGLGTGLGTINTIPFGPSDGASGLMKGEWTITARASTTGYITCTAHAPGFVKLNIINMQCSRS